VKYNYLRWKNENIVWISIKKGSVKSSMKKLEKKMSSDNAKKASKIETTRAKTGLNLQANKVKTEKIVVELEAKLKKGIQNRP